MSRFVPTITSVLFLAFFPNLGATGWYARHYAGKYATGGHASRYARWYATGRYATRRYASRHARWHAG